MNRKTKGYRCMRKERERGWPHSSGIGRTGSKEKEEKRGACARGRGDVVLSNRATAL